MNELLRCRLFMNIPRLPVFFDTPSLRGTMGEASTRSPVVSDLGRKIGAIVRAPSTPGVGVTMAIMCVSSQSTGPTASNSDGHPHPRHRVIQWSVTTLMSEDVESGGKGRGDEKLRHGYE